MRVPKKLVVYRNLMKLALFRGLKKLVLFNRGTAQSSICQRPGEAHSDRH